MCVHWYPSFWKFIDFIFPPNCIGCGITGEKICYSCKRAINIISGGFCEVCGDVSLIYENKLCDRCNLKIPAYEAVRSWAYYEGLLLKAIHDLKYRGNIGIGEALAQPLVVLLKKLSWKIDLVSAVPLDAKKVRQRGFNQSILIGKPLANQAGLVYSSKAIRKIRSTKSQVGLDYSQRIKNVHGAFIANTKIVTGKTILLVDDVITTGATLNACAQALTDAEARLIYGITVARAKRVNGE
jgi:ComF family protein